MCIKLIDWPLDYSVCGDSQIEAQLSQFIVYKIYYITDDSYLITELMSTCDLVHV